MTQEEKQLLLQDLCARLPYNAKADITYSKEHGSSDRLRICSEGCLILNTDVLGLYIEDEIYLKPYLRPLSSMTEEEKKEYHRQADIDLGRTAEMYVIEHSNNMRIVVINIDHPFYQMFYSKLDKKLKFIMAQIISCDEIAKQNVNYYSSYDVQTIIDNFNAYQSSEVSKSLSF